MRSCLNLGVDDDMSQAASPATRGGGAPAGAAAGAPWGRWARGTPNGQQSDPSAAAQLE